MKKSELEWITATGYDPQPELKCALFFWAMQSNTIATLHDWNGDAYTNARALSSDEMSRLIGEAPKKSEIYHPRLIGPRIWWTPKKRRRVSVKNSKMRTFIYPPMVFMVDKHSLFVAQLSRNKKPTEKTKVYKQVVFSGTDVHRSKMAACRVQIPADLDDIEKWEDCFFYSQFNGELRQRGKLQNGVKLTEWAKNPMRKYGA